MQSGVFTAINPTVVTRLNAYGQYEAIIDAGALTAEELGDLGSVSIMSNDHIDESVLGAKLFSHVPGIKHNRLLGYYSDIYAGYVSEASYRASGSSGGVSTWILVQLLRRGLIDGVIHARAAEDEDEVLFKYMVSTSEEEVRTGAKSRYYPMDLSSVLLAVKRRGGRYAITGIPSFISELRLLAMSDPEFNRAIAYTIGLVCGHQKSTKYAEAIAWEHGIRPGELVDVDFRKKVEGRSADEYITELRSDLDDLPSAIEKEASEVFVSSWSHGFFKSKFSDYSDDVFNETADVTLGDAWLPEYTGDYRGTNLVIVRNPDIADILRHGIEDAELNLAHITPSTAIRSQPGLVRHSHDELPYRLFRSDSRREWRPTTRLTADGGLPILRRKIQDVREQIAEQSHIHYKRAVELDDWSYFVRKMKPLVDRHSALYALTDTRRIMSKGPTYLIKRLSRGVKRRFNHRRS